MSSVLQCDVIRLFLKRKYDDICYMQLHAVKYQIMFLPLLLPLGTFCMLHDFLHFILFSGRKHLKVRVGGGGLSDLTVRHLKG